MASGRPTWKCALAITIFLVVGFGSGMYMGESSFELSVKEIQIAYNIKKE